MLYSGKHWGKRANLKKDYLKAVRLQTKKVFPITKQYEVIWTFYFKGVPLDASNCGGMAKMIEDILFEDDAPNIIKSITYKSRKDKDERVEIEVKEIEE